MRRASGFLLAVSVVVAVAGSGWSAAGALVLAAAACAVGYPHVVPTVLRRGIVLLGALAAAGTGVAVGLGAGATAGAGAALTLAARLGVLLLAASVLASRVSAETILAGARRIGMERIGLTLGLALNVLPALSETLHQAWYAAAVRSGRRRPSPRQLPALGEAVLAHTARLADEAAAAAALRGHRALAPAEPPLRAALPVAVLTGPQGSGKTTTLASTVAELKRRGAPVAGFLQPARLQAGERSGFLVRDVASGREERLATRVPRPEGDAGTSYRFHEEGLALAREVMDRCPRGAVLVVDELGPVELRGGGHMKAVRRALAGGAPAAALLVVRRNLVPALLARLHATDPLIVDLDRTPDPVTALVEFCLAALEEHRREPGPGATPHGAPPAARRV